MVDINRKQIRSALQAWHQTSRLGELPLAGLVCVDRRREALGYDASATGRALALRQLLRALLAELRPNEAEPDPANPRWRPYLILTQQYLDGRSPTWVADHLFLAKRTYHKAQAAALDRLATLLQDREQAARQTPSADSAPNTAPLFMAPPRINRPFIGREQLLADIRQRLLAGTSPRLALVGLPGVGKTTLLRELAHDRVLRSAFPDGIFWAGLGQTPALPALLGSWARALGCPERSIAAAQSVAARAALVQARLGTRRALLLIDDAWSGEVAVAFQLGGPHCAALLTTRLRSVAHDFAGSEILTLPAFAAEEGAAFLQATLGEVALAPADLARLNQQAGGLPLALSLMVRYLLYHERDLTRALLRLDAAENRLALSQPQSPLLQEGTRSLGMAIALSVAVLSPAARRLLAALAWLPPRPASLARAAALALAGAEAPLAELLDAGLVEPLGPERLTVHQTIVDYCRSLPVSAAAVASVVTYFASFAEDHAADDSQLALELENITAALQLAGRHNRPVDLARGAVALAPFSTRRGELMMAQQLLATAVAQLTKQVPVSLQARLFLALGDNAARRGDLSAGVAAAEQAQALDQPGDVAAEIAKLLGTLHYRLGDLVLAEQHLEAAAVGFRESGDETGRNSARSLQALCQLQRGNHAAAAATFAALIEASAALGDRYLEVRAWHNLGFTHLLRQDLAAAADAYNRCVALARQYGDHQAVGAALADLGALTGQQGDLSGAQAYYRQALQIAREQGDQLVIAMTLSNLGNVTLDLGLFEEAANYLEQALAISQANGILRTQGSVKIHQARLALLAGNLAEALATAWQALDIAREVADISYEVEALILLGRAALASNVADAVGHFSAARKLAQQHDLSGLAAEASAGEAAAAQYV